MVETIFTVKKNFTINKIATIEHKIYFGLIRSLWFVHVPVADFNRGANRDSGNIALIKAERLKKKSLTQCTHFTML